MLVARREERLRELASALTGALVFGTRTGGRFDPGDVSGRAATAWTNAKVAPYTLHELRHGFAAVCVEAGVNAKRLQTWMGHSSITTTFDLYGKLLDRSEAEQTALVDAYLTGPNRMGTVGPAVGPTRADEGPFGPIPAVSDLATKGLPKGP